MILNYVVKAVVIVEAGVVIAEAVVVLVLE